jgi:hypothetical protein
MPNLREIVQQRAKVPAKIHSLEANVPVRQNAATPTGAGGPLIVEYAAGQVAGAEANGALSGAAPRPPRAPGVSSPGGSSSGAPALRKPSEGRKPRSASEQRAGSVPTAGRRAPSEPANRGNASENGEGRAPAPRAKARAASVNRAKIGDAAPPVDRKDVGKVPAYLRRRQEEMAEDKRRAQRPPSPQAPPGYRKVPDSEKEATLGVLRQRRKEVEVAQRNLPFKIETPGQVKREKDLSDRLAHLDKLLGMFGQPVVFIPADAEPIATTVPPLPSGLAGRPTRERDGSAEDGNENQAPLRGGGGMAEVMNRPSSREAIPRQSSREGRARALAERRVQASEPAPWDKGPIGHSPSSRSNIHTGVQVMAPPGGKSSLNLGWD